MDAEAYKKFLDEAGLVVTPTRYVPHSPGDVEEMLAAVRASSIDDLFADSRMPHAAGAAGVPAGSVGPRCGGAAPPAGRDVPATMLVSFLGAGVYDHYVPAVVDAVAAASSSPRTRPTSRSAARRAADHLRVPDGELRAHRHGRQQRPSMYDGGTAVAEDPFLAGVQTHRGEVVLGRGPPRVPAGAGDRVGRVPGCARRPSVCWRARRPIWAPSPPRSARTRRRSSCSSPTSSPRSRDRAGRRRAGARGRRSLRRGRPIRSSLGLARGGPAGYGADIVVGRGHSRSATRWRFGGPVPGHTWPSPRELMRRMPGPPGRRDGRSSTAAAASCSRCRRASSTSAARRPRATSAPTTRSTRIAAPRSTWQLAGARAGPPDLGLQLCPHRPRYAAGSV